METKIEEHIEFDGLPNDISPGWVIDNIPRCKVTDWVDEIEDGGYLKLYIEFEDIFAQADWRFAFRNSFFYGESDARGYDRAFIKELGAMIKYISEDINHKCEREDACVYSGLSTSVDFINAKGCAVGWFMDQEWAKKLDDAYGGLSYDDLIEKMADEKNKLVTPDKFDIHLIMFENMFSHLQQWHDSLHSAMTEEENIDNALRICEKYLNEYEFNYLKSVI